MLKFVGDFEKDLKDFDYHDCGQERRFCPTDFGTLYIYTTNFYGGNEREIEIYCGDEVPNEIMDKLYDLIKAGLVIKV